MKLVLSALAVCAFGMTANADVLWDNGGWDLMNSAITSEDRADGLISELADDFLLDTAMIIQDVQWWGTYYNSGNPGRDFRIRFYEDNGTGLKPLDTAAYDISVTNAMVNETFVGNDQYGWPSYEYSLDLDTYFTADAGAKYWISIQSVTGDTAGQWGWSGAQPATLLHESVLRSDYFGVPNWTDVSGLVGYSLDQAFVLSGVAVPAPGALALLGLAGLVGRRRR